MNGLRPPSPRPGTGTVTATYGTDGNGEGLSSAVNYDVEVYDPWTQQITRLLAQVPTQRRYPSTIKIIAAQPGDTVPVTISDAGFSISLAELPAIRVCPAP